ncbi:MAG TPA: MerR family transcriptional regulator [Candidatus Sulfotelmatobacter sp.]|jgi:DNA-binding transcriptional MerR regulator|nr:MerR family transcriptional regulator [Candidatus Sulfotelmatobacter sp.]
MNASFRIGELASRTGRSIHTIRWYEAQGLIPGIIRDSGGRRMYNDLHLSWLDLMDRLRRTGMSIAQMRNYTALVKQGSKTLRQRQLLLSQHRSRVQQTIAEWEQALQLIDSKIDFYGEWLATGKRPQLSRPPKGAPARVRRKGLASRRTR